MHGDNRDSYKPFVPTLDNCIERMQVLADITQEGWFEDMRAFGTKHRAVLGQIPKAEFEARMGEDRMERIMRHYKAHYPGEQAS